MRPEIFKIAAMKASEQGGSEMPVEKDHEGEPSIPIHVVVRRGLAQPHVVLLYGCETQATDFLVEAHLNYHGKRVVLSEAPSHLDVKVLVRDCSFVDEFRIETTSGLLLASMNREELEIKRAECSGERLIDPYDPDGIGQTIRDVVSALSRQGISVEKRSLSIQFSASLHFSVDTYTASRRTLKGGIGGAWLELNLTNPLRLGVVVDET
jgi:hypothetical protein